MTESEANYEIDRAIDLIKRIKTEETHERYIDRHKAFDLAIKVLEKQIPKKVVYYLCGYYLCPTCEHYICDKETAFSLNDDDFSYCDACGQKLKWSDEECE